MFKEFKNKMIVKDTIFITGILTITCILIFLVIKRLLFVDSIAIMEGILYDSNLIHQNVEEDLEDTTAIENPKKGVINQSDYVFVTYDKVRKIITHNDTKYLIKTEELINDFESIINSGNNVGNSKYKNKEYRYMIHNKTFKINDIDIVFYDLESENKILGILIMVFIVIDIVLAMSNCYLTIRTIDKALVPIEETIKNQKQFTENASHELRTPLTVMKTNIAVLKSEKDSKISEQYKWIEYIDDEITRMSKLVNELLILTRLDNDSRREEVEAINLTEELKKIIEEYSNLIDEKGLTLTSKLAKNIYFKGELTRIRQLINIFLDNAIKYNKPDGTISIILRKGETTFDLIFKDTGIGIAKKDVNKVFNRFFRSDLSRATEGTGLGLPIAYGIINKHNGTVKVTSEKGRGSKFTITFPYINNL